MFWVPFNIQCFLNHPTVTDGLDTPLHLLACGNVKNRFSTCNLDALLVTLTLNEVVPSPTLWMPYRILLPNLKEDGGAVVG